MSEVGYEDPSSLTQGERDREEFLDAQVEETRDFYTKKTANELQPDDPAYRSTGQIVQGNATEEYDQKRNGEAITITELGREAMEWGHNSPMMTAGQRPDPMVVANEYLQQVGDFTMQDIIDTAVNEYGVDQEVIDWMTAAPGEEVRQNWLARVVSPALTGIIRAHEGFQVSADEVPVQIGWESDLNPLIEATPDWHDARGILGDRDSVANLILPTTPEEAAAFFGMYLGTGVILNGVVRGSRFLRAAAQQRRWHGQWPYSPLEGTLLPAQPRLGTGFGVADDITDLIPRPGPGHDGSLQTVWGVKGTPGFQEALPPLADDTLATLTGRGASNVPVPREANWWTSLTAPSLSESTLAAQLWDNVAGVTSSIERSITGGSSWFDINPWIGHSNNLSALMDDYKNLTGAKEAMGDLWRQGPKTPAERGYKIVPTGYDPITELDAAYEGLETAHPGDLSDPFAQYQMAQVELNARIERVLGMEDVVPKMREIASQDAFLAPRLERIAAIRDRLNELSPFSPMRPGFQKEIDELLKDIQSNLATQDILSSGSSVAAFRSMGSIIFPGYEEFVGDPLFREFIQLGERVSLAEKDHTLEPWSEDSSAIMGTEPFDWLAFSRSRGYSEEEIADFKRWLEVEAELSAKYPDNPDFTAAIDHDWKMLKESKDLTLAASTPWEDLGMSELDYLSEQLAFAQQSKALVDPLLLELNTLGHEPNSQIIEDMVANLHPDRVREIADLVEWSWTWQQRFGSNTVNLSGATPIDEVIEDLTKKIDESLGFSFDGEAAEMTLLEGALEGNATHPIMPDPPNTPEELLNQLSWHFGYGKSNPLNPNSMNPNLQAYKDSLPQEPLPPTIGEALADGTIHDLDPASLADMIERHIGDNFNNFGFLNKPWNINASGLPKAQEFALYVSDELDWMATNTAYIGLAINGSLYPKRPNKPWVGSDEFIEEIVPLLRERATAIRPYEGERPRSLQRLLDINEMKDLPVEDLFVSLNNYFLKEWDRLGSDRDGWVTAFGGELDAAGYAELKMSGMDRDNLSTIIKDIEDETFRLTGKEYTPWDIDEWRDTVGTDLFEIQGGIIEETASPGQLKSTLDEYFNNPEDYASSAEFTYWGRSEAEYLGELTQDVLRSIAISKKVDRVRWQAMTQRTLQMSDEEIAERGITIYEYTPSEYDKALMMESREAVQYLARLKEALARLGETG